MEKGYVQVYTGNGKGKSTAAFGLAVRAACAGKKVYIGQFVKDMAYSETKIAEVMPNIHIEQLGVGCFIDRSPNAEDCCEASEALNRCAAHMHAGTYDVVILDEVHIALYFKLIDVKALIESIENRAPFVEVVTTGRYAPEALMAYADLVTEMKEQKHYYEQGVLSREGIDF